MAMDVYLKNKLLNHVLRGEVFTPPAKVYITIDTSTYYDSSIPQQQAKEITFAAGKPAINTNSVTWGPRIDPNYPSGSTVMRIPGYKILDAPNGNVLFTGAAPTPGGGDYSDPSIWPTHGKTYTWPANSVSISIQ